MQRGRSARSRSARSGSGATTSACASGAGDRRRGRGRAPAGITLFDTADSYGRTKSETYLGEALGPSRDEVVVATKFGKAYGGDEGGAAPAYVRRAVEAA